MSAGKRRAVGATRRRGRRREVHSPRASYEELEIRTEDGVALRAVLDDPPEGVALRGTCVLAHAMLARKTEFGSRERAGLRGAYAAAGWRTIAFDFRGHGDSALPRGAREWGYDDLVRRDLPAVVACARDRGEGRPVVVVGHSLGADVALAAQGTGRMAADALVVIAASVWLRAFERSPLRWAAKRVLARTMQEAVERFGRLPARALRLGSDDASARFVRDLVGFMRDERWQSEDGADDYLASLARVVVPVCAVASLGDRLVGHPDSSSVFVRRCGGPLRFLRVSRSEDGGSAPGHMALVTSDRARSSLIEALAWVEWRAAHKTHTLP